MELHSKDRLNLPIGGVKHAYIKRFETDFGYAYSGELWEWGSVYLTSSSV